MESRGRRLAFVLVSAAVLALFLRLGFWQLGRLEERRSANAVRGSAMGRPVLELPAGTADAVQDGGAAAEDGAGRAAGDRRRGLPPADSLHWRRVSVEGRFDYGREVVLAPRSLAGTPAVYLLTPLLLEDPASGDSVALPVLRGAVPAPDGYHAPVGEARPPDGAGTVTVRGLALPPPDVDPVARPDTLHSAVGVHGVLPRLDLARVRERVPYRVVDVYVQADATTESIPPSEGIRLPLRLDPPTLDDGPHLMYAIQWFAFAAILLVGGTIYLLRSDG